MAEVKKPRAQITISRIIDIESVTRYYKLQSASAAAPSKPTDGAAIPSGWTKTEPAYQNGATNRLYFVDQTIMTNGDTHYSQVSLSSSYEAAKEAWNKANNAQNAANDANNKVDNLQVGGRNLIPDTTSMKTWAKGDKLNITYDQEDDRSGKNAVKVVNTQGTAGGAWFNRLMSSGVTCQIGTYTISFYAKSDSDTESTIQAVAVTKPGSSDRSVSKTFYVNKTWKRYTFTYDIVESYTTTSDVYWFNFLGTSAIYFAHFKLERGNIATDWTPAPEDVDSAINSKISSVDVEYYLSTSATALSGGSWVTTAPTWVNGKYMWSRTKKVDGAGNVTYSPSANGTCIAGAAGATGAAGKGVKSYNEQYYKSTSATALSGGSWSGTYPGWENGKYIWTRSVITYTDNTTTTTAAICVTGQKGDTGAKGDKGATGAAGKGIKTTVVTYQAGSSGTMIPTGIWVSSPPATTASAPYMWTRTVITYTDNTTSTSYSVGSTPEGVISKVDKKLEAKVNVDSVISAINASAETVAIEGKKVNLKGAVTFESFDSATQTKVNIAKSTADTAKATADNASKTAKAISDNIYTANTTTIDGAKITTGSIKAEQIDVNTIFAEDVEATGTIKGVNIKGASGEFTKDFSVNTLVSESNDKDQNIYFKIYNNKDGIFIGLKSETQANSYISLEALSAALVGLNVTIGGVRSVKISAQTGMMLNCPNGVSVNDLSVTKNVHVAGNLYRNGKLIGETFYGNSTTAKAIKSGAWSNTNSSMTLPPGVYMMTGTILFAASKGGRLGARFATSDNGFDQTTNVIPGTTTAATGYVQCQWIMSVTEETKYYLQAWQSSGANVNVTASYMKAVRIA